MTALWDWKLGLILAVVSWFWLGDLLRREQLSRARKNEIATSEGYVKLSGTASVLFGQIIRDPVKFENCLWYRVETYKAVHWLLHERGESNRELVDTRTSDNPFRLQDDTGNCQLKLAAGDVQLRTLTPEEVEEGDLTHSIYRIRPGDNLYARGILVPLESPMPEVTHELVGEQRAELMVAVGYDDPALDETDVDELVEKRFIARIGIALGLAWTAAVLFM